MRKVAESDMGHGVVGGSDWSFGIKVGRGNCEKRDWACRKKIKRIKNVELCHK